MGFKLWPGGGAPCCEDCSGCCKCADGSKPICTDGHAAVCNAGLFWNCDDTSSAYCNDSPEPDNGGIPCPGSLGCQCCISCSTPDFWKFTLPSDYFIGGIAPCSCERFNGVEYVLQRQPYDPIGDPGGRTDCTWNFPQPNGLTIPCTPCDFEAVLSLDNCFGGSGQFDIFLCDAGGGEGGQNEIFYPIGGAGDFDCCVPLYVAPFIFPNPGQPMDVPCTFADSAPNICLKPEPPCPCQLCCYDPVPTTAVFTWGDLVQSGATFTPFCVGGFAHCIDGVWVCEEGDPNCGDGTIPPTGCNPCGLVKGLAGCSACPPAKEYVCMLSDDCTWVYSVGGVTLTIGLTRKLTGDGPCGGVFNYCDDNTGETDHGKCVITVEITGPCWHFLYCGVGNCCNGAAMTAVSIQMQTCCVPGVDPGCALLPVNYANVYFQQTNV